MFQLLGKTEKTYLRHCLITVKEREEENKNENRKDVKFSWVLQVKYKIVIIFFFEKSKTHCPNLKTFNSHKG